MALLVLPLVSGGMIASQGGCSSQTAVALVAADGGPPAGDAPQPGGDGSDGVPEVADASDGPAPGADAADALADSSDVADALPAGPEGPDSAPDAGPDLTVPADVLLDVVEVLPEVAREAARELASELAPEVANRDSGPVVLFSDGFDGGYEVNWLLSESSDGPVTNTRDGSNPVATLDSTAADFTRLRCNLEGDKFTEQNITASMRLRVETPPLSTRSVRLDVRQSGTTANIFYAVGAVVATDGTITSVGIFKKIPDGMGDYTICKLAESADFATPIAMNQWRRIRLTISGTDSVLLTAFFEDLQVATYIDDCTSDLEATNGVKVANGGCLVGQTALGIQVEKGLKVSVDDVLVTTP